MFAWLQTIRSYSFDLDYHQWSLIPAVDGTELVVQVYPAPPRPCGVINSMDELELQAEKHSTPKVQ